MNEKKPYKQSSRPPHYPRYEADHASELDENCVVGRNSVRELLESGRDIDKIFCQKGDKEGSILQLLAIARERHIPLIECEKRKLDELSRGLRHQGVVAMAAARSYASIDDMIALAASRGEEPLLVIADGIEDPHNLGAIIRSAECAGAHGIIIPKRRSALLSATVSKSSAGALEHMPVARVANLTSVCEELKKRGFWLYAADMDGVSCYETDLCGKTAIVLGSEGFGISKLLREHCDFVVSIPMYGSLNSLNVSVAAGVLLLEAAKQRHM